jgi:non-heme chloroperoxidase
MKYCRLSVAMFFFFLIGALHAQEISGKWQGTLQNDSKLRLILQIEKGDDDTLKARMYSVDQTPEPVSTTTLSFVGSTLKFTIAAFHVSYEGTLSADGRTISGRLTQEKSDPLVFERTAEETEWTIDASPHKVLMIPVGKNVTLEVLDWGGTGRPLVLLSGLGDTAHVFDTFAPKLTAKYHVYGITRRGFGASSAPSPETASYAVDRLGGDVLAVIDALHLEHPVVVGHSIAGQELSYIGSHHSEKVAGLIYLDAGYEYALYDKVNGSLWVDVIVLREQIREMLAGKNPSERKRQLDDMIANLQQVEKEAVQQRQEMQAMPAAPAGSPDAPPIIGAISMGLGRFTTIKAPALVIFVEPHDLGDMVKEHPERRAELEAADKAKTERQAVAFETQVPSAHVVRIPHTDHYVFRTNEAEVIRDMNGFIATLP